MTSSGPAKRFVSILTPSKIRWPSLAYKFTTCRENNLKEKVILIHGSRRMKRGRTYKMGTRSKHVVIALTIHMPLPCASSLTRVSHCAWFGHYLWRLENASEIEHSSRDLRHSKAKIISRVSCSLKALLKKINTLCRNARFKLLTTVRWILRRGQGKTFRLDPLFLLEIWGSWGLLFCGLQYVGRAQKVQMCIKVHWFVYATPSPWVRGRCGVPEKPESEKILYDSRKLHLRCAWRCDSAEIRRVTWS